MRLILFDIDGTLVDCGAQVRSIFAGALREVYGRTGDLSAFDFAGKTDRGIVCQLMREAGLPPDAVEAGLEAVRGVYLERLAARLEPARMRLLPGVIPLLERLSRRPEVVVGLLTGNWEGGARVKLAPFGLERFFRFGVFGDDDVDRRALPPKALARAARLVGRPLEPSEALVVGDSPLDVACARAHGLAALAVATGTTTAQTLAAAGPDWVITDLGSAHLCHPVLAA